MSSYPAKPGVKASFSKAINYALGVADTVYSTIAGHGIFITSGNDSKHRSDSKHYSGNAVDIRTHGLSETQKDSIFNQLKSELYGRGFDVLLEYRGTAQEHIHIEYDPRQGREWNGQDTPQTATNPNPQPKENPKQLQQLEQNQDHQPPVFGKMPNNIKKALILAIGMSIMLVAFTGMQRGK